MIVPVKDTKRVEELFGEWQETLIWSCLQNIMGQIYGEEVDRPTSAMALIGDFCFFAGCPNERLVAFKPQECDKDFIIMVPQNQQWAGIIEKIYEGRAKKVTRYAIKKEMGVLDKGKLQGVVDSLELIYSLRRIDQEIFEMCRANEWSRDLVSQYKDYEEYEKLGVGYVILKGDAQNIWSVALAEKLGYHYEHEYTAYEI